MTARRMPPRRGVSAAWTAVTASPTTTASATKMDSAKDRRAPAAIRDLPSAGTLDCFLLPIVADGTARNRTCQPVSLVRRDVRWRRGRWPSVFRQPDVLELLIRVVIGRGHIVLHLGPVHHAPRPPETRDVVRVLEDDLLHLVHDPPALGRVQGSRLTREEVVDPGIGEAPPVVGVPRGVPLEKQIGVVHVVEDPVDDHLEASRVPPIREP